MEKAPAQSGAAEVQVTPLIPASPEGTPDESQPGLMPKALSAVQGSPEAQQLDVQAPQELVQQAPPPVKQPVGGGVWTLLTMLQILLAILAVVSGTAALVIRRASRR